MIIIQSVFQVGIKHFKLSNRKKPFKLGKNTNSKALNLNLKKYKSTNIEMISFQK